MTRHFLSTGDFSSDDLSGLIDAALRFKAGEDRTTPLSGRSIGLVFFNPSTLGC